MIEIFKELPSATQTAIIAALTALLTTTLSLVAKSWSEKKTLLDRLESENKYEQQRELKKIMAKNKMRLLNSAEALNHRLWNYMENHAEPWLEKRGNYYFSFVYRFISFFAYIRLIESELIFIDSTYAERSDLEFVKFLKTFPQLFCDVKLFTGEAYDKNHSTDHFFKNDFENICDSFVSNNEVVTYAEYLKDIKHYQRKNAELFRFFDSICVNEPRFRYDLIKHLHLTLIAFLNTYGYEYQRSTWSHTTVRTFEVETAATCCIQMRYGVFRPCTT